MTTATLAIEPLLPAAGTTDGLTSVLDEYLALVEDYGEEQAGDALMAIVRAVKASRGGRLEGREIAVRCPHGASRGTFLASLAGGALIVGVIAGSGLDVTTPPAPLDEMGATEATIREHAVRLGCECGAELWQRVGGTNLHAEAGDTPE